MKYLLDTSICIHIIRRHPSATVERIRSTAPEDIGVSTITLAELEYGAAKSLYPDRNRLALLEFLIPFTIIDFDQGAAAHYGSIRATLEAKGKPIGAMDMLIAAQAKSRVVVLVTNNVSEFRRVEGLEVENWVAG